MNAINTAADHTTYRDAAEEEVLQRAADQLRARGFRVEVIEDAEAARFRIGELVPAGASVFTGTSETLRTSGIEADLNDTGRYDAIKPRTSIMDRARRPRRSASSSLLPTSWWEPSPRSPRPVP